MDSKNGGKEEKQLKRIISKKTQKSYGKIKEIPCIRDFFMLQCSRCDYKSRVFIFCRCFLTQRLAEELKIHGSKNQTEVET